MHKEISKLLNNLLAVVFSFLTTAPLTFFLYDQYRDIFIFPSLYILVEICLILFSIPLFNAYCRHQVFNFEDQENAVTDRIVIAIITAGILMALITVKMNLYYFFLAIPYIFTLLFSYVIIVFNSLRDKTITGIIKLSYLHYRKVTIMVIISIIVKIIFLLIIKLLDFQFAYFVLTFAGFVSDIILLFITRAEIYVLDIQKDGFSRRNISSIRSLLIVPFTVLAGLTALFSGRNASLLSIDNLSRFFRWLSSLSYNLPNRTGEILMDTGSFSNSKESNPLEALRALNDGGTFFIDPIIRLLGKLLLAELALMLVYFIFYPIIAPLIFRKRKRISFRTYYSGLIKSLADYFKNIRKIILSVFEKNQTEVNEKKDKAGTAVSTLSKKNDPGKRSELKAVKRQYVKLKRWAEKKWRFSPQRAISVGEFFLFLTDRDPSSEKNFAELAVLFNKSFFSYCRLSRDEMRSIGMLMNRVMKGN